jgi:type I restriction enzyme S subunit
MKTSFIELGKIVSVSSGQGAPQDSKYFCEDGTPFIRAGSLGFLINGGNENDCEKVTDEAAKKHRLRLFPPNTILFAKSGMSAKIGRVYRTKYHCYVVSHLAAIIPGPEIDPSYLQRWFEKHPPSKLIPNEAYPSIRLSEISKLKISLPSLSDQKRIAAILDKADAIRRKRRQAIQLADEFLRSVFLDMFGDPVNNPKGWKKASVGEKLTFLTSGSRGWAKYYSTEGRLFLRIQNIGANQLLLNDVAFVNPPDSAEARRTATKAGDVLLSITADLGRTAVIPNDFPPAHINQHLSILRFDDIEPLFASAYLASKGGQNQIQKLNREGVKAGLNFENIRSLNIYLPPKDLQKKWSDIYSKNLTQKSLLKHSLRNQNELFNSIAQRAFGGEL